MPADATSKGQPQDRRRRRAHDGTKLLREFRFVPFQQEKVEPVDRRYVRAIIKQCLNRSARRNDGSVGPGKQRTSAFGIRLRQQPARGIVSGMRTRSRPGEPMTERVFKRLERRVGPHDHFSPVDRFAGGEDAFRNRCRKRLRPGVGTVVRPAAHLREPHVGTGPQGADRRGRPNVRGDQRNAGHFRNPVVQFLPMLRDRRVHVIHSMRADERHEAILSATLFDIRPNKRKNRPG